MRFTVWFLSGVALLGAAEWPQFRGAESNPISADTRLPDKWSATENVEWSTAVPGRGWSSPIVSKGRIFLTTVVTDGESKKPQTGTEYSNQYVAELQKQGLDEKEIMARVMARDFELPHEVNLRYFLYCLDLATGAVRWKREFHSGHPPGGRHRKNSFTSETPVTDGSAIYVYTGNVGLHAFDFDGKQLWRTPVEANPIYLEFGTAASPVLHGDRIFIVSDNQERQYAAAFDKRTGKQVWRANRDIGETTGSRMRSAWTTPYIWKNKVRTELVTVGPKTAISYDLEGKELWRLNGVAASPIPSPFATGGLLYLNGGRGKPLFAIRPGATGDITLGEGARSNVSIAWTERRSGVYLPTPVAYEGALYVLGETGIFSRIDAATGKLTYRARLDDNAGSFTVSPWAYNGRIFCLNEDGRTFVVAAGEEFQLLRTNDLDDFSMASPAIAGDRLLVRTESTLYSFRTRSAPK
ncbi:MAG: PQQ-binding-like beta-propeller repeat protein [Bryobacteraceae bacterium]